jgi:predicted TIM-barrel fold metal-dependent hydrolase
MRVSRRSFCGRLILPIAAYAQTKVASRRIDVHHHILPPAYVSAIGAPAVGAASGSPGAPPWTVQTSLDMMDHLGIGTSITSLSSPGIRLDDPKAVQRIARVCNDFAKQMATDHPGRFGIFAFLPLPDIAASLDEIRYAFEELKADGIGLHTNYRDRYLGDPHFAPVFEELNRRKAVVHVHPTICNCMLGVQPDIPPALIEFPQDTTRTIASLLWNGTFQRNPQIRFIFSHAGGTMPMLINKIGSNAAFVSRLGAGGWRPIVQRLYYDTALSGNPQSMGALLGLVGAGRVLLGTDFPFVSEARAKSEIDGIQIPSLSAKDLDRVHRENAALLFPLLAG